MNDIVPQIRELRYGWGESTRTIGNILEWFDLPYPRLPYTDLPDLPS